MTWPCRYGCIRRMHLIAAGRFKDVCLKMLGRSGRTRTPRRFTKRGKRVAQFLLYVASDPVRSLAGSIHRETGDRYGSGDQVGYGTRCARFLTPTPGSSGSPKTRGCRTWRAAPSNARRRNPVAGRVLDLESGEERTEKLACSEPAGRSAACSSRRTSRLATTSRSARSGEDRSGSHASMYPTLRWLDTTVRDRDWSSSWPIDVATDKGDALHGTGCRLPGLVRTPVLVDGRALSGGLSTLRETYADFGIRAGNGVGEVASAPGESRRFAPPPLRYGLWDEVKDRVHESGVALSGGRQQRLRIVRALTIPPDILRITSRRRFQSWRL